MSVENLMQVVRPPSSSLDGAPRGTNAKYFYSEMFRNLCEKEFRSFAKTASKEVTAWGGRPAMPRSFYIPKTAPNLKQIPEGQDLDLEFWSYEDSKGGIYGLAFWGKQNKPLWHYHFRSQDQLDKQIQETIQSRKSHVDTMQERRQKRLEYKHNLKEGDILYSSWGYDQTNIDFYQVIEVGEKSVKIRGIGSKIVDSSPGSDMVAAVPGSFHGPTMTKMVGQGDVVRISSYASAYPWDGKPKHETAAGYGH